MILLKLSPVLWKALPKNKEPPYGRKKYQLKLKTEKISSHEDELKHNGYFLCKGKQLKDFKLQFGHENNFVSKITQLGLFDFRALYIWHVAAGNIDKELLAKIIYSVINREELDEGTKLEVIHAMEKSPLFSEKVDE